MNKEARDGLSRMLIKFEKDTKQLFDLGPEFDDEYVILTNRAIESTFAIEKYIERRK